MNIYTNGVISRLIGMDRADPTRDQPRLGTIVQSRFFPIIIFIGSACVSIMFRFDSVDNEVASCLKLQMVLIMLECMLFVTMYFFYRDVKKKTLKTMEKQFYLSSRWVDIEQNLPHPAQWSRSESENLVPVETCEPDSPKLPWSPWFGPRHGATNDSRGASLCSPLLTTDE